MNFVDELNKMDQVLEEEYREKMYQKADAIILALKKRLIEKRKEGEVNCFQCYFSDSREDDGEFPRVKYDNYLYGCCEEDEQKFISKYRFCIPPKSFGGFGTFGHMASCPKNEDKEYLQELLEFRLKKLGFKDYSVKFYDISYYEKKFLGYKHFATLPNVLFMSVKW